MAGLKKQSVRNIEPCSIPCLVESITGVWKFQRLPGKISHARSLPGHLFHYMISGKYHLKANGREYDVKPGEVIYYHEVEEVEVKCDDDPIEFYSVGFLAPNWAALPLSMRVFHGGAAFEKIFAAIYDSFNNAAKPVFHARLFANIFRLIELVENRRYRIEPFSKINQSLWWEVENSLLRNRNFHASIHDMTEMALVSKSTLNRACRIATGLSPLQRVIRLRMNHAQGLLKYSSLSVGEVAKYLGYSRVNEFSREYHEHIGISPCRDRALGKAGHRG